MAFRERAAGPGLQVLLEPNGRLFRGELHHDDK